MVQPPFRIPRTTGGILVLWWHRTNQAVNELLPFSSGHMSTNIVSSMREHRIHDRLAPTEVLWSASQSDQRLHKSRKLEIMLRLFSRAKLT
jgi:hypothetical protein